MFLCKVGSMMGGKKAKPGRRPSFVLTCDNSTKMYILDLNFLTLWTSSLSFIVHILGKAMAWRMNMNLFVCEMIC